MSMRPTGRADSPSPPRLPQPVRQAVLGTRSCFRGSSSGILAAFLISALSLCSLLLPAQQIAPPPVQPQPASAGSENRDLLLLVNGDTLRGHLLNENLSLRTAYAQLKLPRRMLALLEPLPGSQGLQCLLTINSNRFTGFLEEATFSFQPENGPPLQVRREKVSRLVLVVPAEARQSIPQGHWICLHNGDKLSGQFLTDPLPLLTVSGQRPISLKEVVAVSLAPNQPAAFILALRTGQTVQGTLALEDLPIRLDVGPQLTLYKESIEGIGRYHDCAAGALTTRLEAPLQKGAPASSATATNLEGFVWIAPGQFIMGSPVEELGRDPDEGLLTRVTIEQGFWMAKCEVTQAEYQQVMGINPSNFTGDTNLPVEKVSWFEASEYCAKLNQLAQGRGRLPTGYAYRLPTEAEWEYACRAGTSTPFSYGADRSGLQLADYSWFTRNSDSTTHPVGSRRPNPWGLQDMHGNVWEWCLDRWEGALPGGSLTNRAVTSEGSLRVARGGSWLYEAKACRSANRDDYSPWNRCGDLGFRVVLAPLEH